MPFTIIDLWLLAAGLLLLAGAGASLALTLWRSTSVAEGAPEPRLRLVHSVAPASAQADQPATVTEKPRPAIASR